MSRERRVANLPASTGTAPYTSQQVAAGAQAYAQIPTEFHAQTLIVLSRARHNGRMKTLIVLSRPLALACGVLLISGAASFAAARDDAAQQPSAREQLQQIHTPQSIGEKLAQLAKDLELTPEQLQQVRPLLQEHHDRIQALLDKNPAASRAELGPQIHAISDDTHAKIHALLTDHQRELEKAMQQRPRNGGENTRAVVPPR